MAEILRMENATKVFGSLVANDKVNFTLEKGQIHALLGENGAGKSTLMNCLYGILPLTEGKIFLEGKEINIESPLDAIKYGIGMVHQHFMLMEQLTVTENIILGMKQEKEPWLDIKKAERRIKELSDKYNFEIDPHSLIKDISVGMQQRVEIMKALYRDANIMIFDEPTAVLTPQEITHLFGIIRNLAREGKSIIMIVHKLEEVMEICDKVTVLRDGKKIGTVDVKETDPRQLANMMVGRDVVLDLKRDQQSRGEAVMNVEDVSLFDRHHKALLSDISLELYKGEILGVAGIDGNGQTELSEVLTGMTPIAHGRIVVNGEDMSGKGARSYIEKKVSHIPQDRQKTGLIMPFSVMENMILQQNTSPEYRKKGILNWKKIQNHAQELVNEYQIKVTDVKDPVSSLSGGNQQKVILAREINRDAEVLVAVQPTRGLDIGATEFVRKKLLEEREKGVAVILISTELDEILTLSDRIAVMHGGRFIDVFNNGERTIEQIGLMMAGMEISEGSKDDSEATV